ncbi:unnamed protein product, partial [Ectocarpus fasciculatus]
CPRVVDPCVLRPGFVGMRGQWPNDYAYEFTPEFTRVFVHKEKWCQMQYPPNSPGIFFFLVVLTAYLLSCLFPPVTLLFPSAEYGSQGDGGLQGLQGFGDLGDGSSRGAWQDLAATYSLPTAGGAYDEESSDGESTAGGTPPPPPPDRGDSVGSSRDGSGYVHNNRSSTSSPQGPVVRDFLSDVFVGAGSGGSASPHPSQGEIF